MKLFIFRICNLDQLEKHVSRKPNLNISGIFLKIFPRSFSTNLPTVEIV